MQAYIGLEQWPSGLRRKIKALVFGRGFESHLLQKLLPSFFNSRVFCLASAPPFVRGDRNLTIVRTRQTH